MTLNDELAKMNREVDNTTQDLNARIKALHTAIQEEKEKANPPVEIPQKQPLVTDVNNQNQEPTNGV